MGADTTVPYVVGMTREEAQQRVKDRGFGCQIVGDGDTITDQTPAGGAIIPGNATVILYAGAEKATEVYCPQPAGPDGVGGQFAGQQRRTDPALHRRHQQHLRQHRGAESGCRGRCSGGARHRHQRAAGRYQPQRLSQNRAERKMLFVDLRALLAGLTSAAVPQVPEVTGVCCDSQRIRPGDVFVAIPGFREDGRCHIAEAKARGAVCVLSREPVQELPWAAVQDPRRALAEVSARLYRHPDRELAVVGVTGTNGKTTTTCLVRHILRQTLGVRVGLIGTIRNLIDETELETERTTPESCDVYRLLRQMADAGCRYGVMEVSSHALALERVWGITFRVGAFTNLTRDHLDFHRTMEDYCDAKAQLFRQCEAAVCNGDDPWTPRLLRECACPVLRYGTGDSSRLRGENLRLTARSVTFDALLDGRRIPVTVPIPGRFTVYNALAALGICHMLGVPPEQGAAALQTASGIKGRMEVVPTPGLPCTVLIDYAHTPDALENVLTAVRGFAEGRVVAVFGCGGDRDREKRPQMGRIVSRLADVAVVTSDNPRWEQPEKIIEDILPGMTGPAESVVICDRREAIGWTLKNSRPGDVIVLCGKGHETYQEVCGEKRHMDERELVAAYTNG